MGQKKAEVQSWQRAHRPDGHPLGGAMAAWAVAEYIETMMIHTGRLQWPTLCRVCHQWQGQIVCAHCVLAAQLDAPRCHRCAMRVNEGISLCQACEDLPPQFDHAVAALDYSLPWQGLIKSLKFKQDTALARTLATLMAQGVRQRWAARPRPPDALNARSPARLASSRPGQRQLRPGAPTVVMPVPLSKQRLQERGFNQAGLLAGHLAQQLALPVLHDGLVRRRHTQRLMTLDADARQLHIRGAFEVHEPGLKHVRHRHVAVVDDVLTSGATLNEIARTLWLAGAHEVSVWVVARTPLPHNMQSASGSDTTGPQRAFADTAWADTILAP
jgi:ComF family protein